METHESFDWFREDIKTMSGERRGKWVTFKGVALFPTVSRNQREYIENECMLSARTLANVPIDINHAYDVWLDAKKQYETAHPGLSYESITPSPPLWGNVIDAEWEDGRIEYVAQAKGEYGEKIIDKEKLTKEQYKAKWGKEPLYGVSISASYRYAADDEEMLTPLGLKFNRLSLVEDPEHPGVIGTTVELLESYNRQSIKEVEVVGNLLKIASPSLFESYRDEVIKPYKEGKPLENKEYVTSPLELLDYGELHEKKKPEEETIVDEESTEEPIQETDTTIVEEEPEDEPDTPEEVLEELTVTEPMGDYKDFDSCVAKNQDKEDPEAYCGSIKKKTEELALEKLDFTAFDAKPEYAKQTGDAEVDAKVQEVNQKRRELSSEKKEQAIKESLSKLHMNTVKLAKRQETIITASTEANQCIGKKLSETQKQVKSLLERLEDKAGVDKVEKLRETMTGVKEKLDAQEHRLKETEGELLPIVETLNSVVETVTGFTDLIDELKKDVKAKGEQLVSLRKALEVSGQNNTKLATKISTLEVKHEASTKSLLETLDKITKRLDEEEDDEKKQLNQTLETLTERLENIEETTKGEFKSNHEAEHTTPKTGLNDDVFMKDPI